MRVFEEVQLKLLTELPGLDAQMKMSPPVRKRHPDIPSNVRYSAVCILLLEKEKEPYTLLIKRTVDGKTHSGQIAFPGGQIDKPDSCLTYTALRECEEEIGIPVRDIHVLGCLTPLYIPPSNFIVHPVLARISSLTGLQKDTREIDRIIPANLNQLFSSKSNALVKRSDAPHIQMHTPVYHLPTKEYVWGATAMILSEVEALFTKD